MPSTRRQALKRAASPPLFSPLMQMASGFADESRPERGQVKRLVCVGNPFGFLPDEFFKVSLTSSS